MFSLDLPEEIIARAECLDTNKIIAIAVNGTICISIGITLIILVSACFEFGHLMI